MKEVKTQELKQYLGQEVKLSGWVFNLRSSGKIAFLQFCDG